MQKSIQFIAILGFILSLIAFYFSLTANQRLRTLGCDVSEGFLAEREYTYPILRTIDDPENYGIGIDNPLRTKAIYNVPCK